MQPLVSIIVPVYNAQQWLAETLQSALNQTWQRKEIIVVDDGSTDNSFRIASELDSPIVKVLSQSQKGAAAARNAGLSVAQGDFIQYLDADDLLAPNKIELQIKRLQSAPANVVSTCKWTRFYGDVDSAQFGDQADFCDYENPIDWIIQSWNGQGTMPPVAWLLPRAVCEKAGPWDERLSLSDDTEYFSRVALHSSQIAFCAEARGFYRSGNQTLSGRKDRTAWESYFLVCELSTKELLDYECSERARRACANLWQFFAFQAYPNVPDLVRRAEEQVKRLNGTDLKFEGSPALRQVTRVAGWKAARRLQQLYYDLRY